MDRKEVKHFLQTHSKVFNRDGEVNSNITRYLKNNYPDVYNGIWVYTSFLPKDATIPQRIYCIYYDIQDEPKCKICGSNDIKFFSWDWGYRETCSTKCGSRLTAQRRESGELPPHTISEEGKQNIAISSSNTRLGKTLEEIHGEEKARIIRQEKSEKSKGHKTIYDYKGGSTYEDVYGKEKADEIKRKIGINSYNHRKGKPIEEVFGEKHAQKIRERHKWMKGKTLEEMYGEEKAKEIKNKMGGGSYNKYACEFFEHFNEALGTNGQHGTNLKEYCCITENNNRYFLDYINHDLKLIIEWDEEYHYVAKGKLSDYDIARQKEIQEEFPTFDFIRIRQKEVQDKDFDEFATNIMETIKLPVAVLD